MDAGFLEVVMKTREWKWLLRSTDSLDFFLGLSALGFGVGCILLSSFNLIDPIKYSQHLLLAFAGLFSLAKLFWPARPPWLTTLLVKGLVCVSFVSVLSSSIIGLSELQIFYILYSVGSFASLMGTR